ncbi:MAG TPA: acyltransferase family protein [Arenimonas sp.]|nr:acyltransferase family protein [Arenimonas sp.]
MQAGAAQERLHYMDHLRALAMLAGVFFHTALAYSPLMHGFWPMADRQSSAWVDAVVWGLHLVRMPLFFLVAGFFAAWILARRGGVALARQRVRRILVPFLLAWPLVLISLAASTGWAAANVQHPSPLLLMIRDWMSQPDPPRMPPGTAHLWFLYYLLLLAVLHWVFRTLELGRLGQRLLQRHPAWLLLGLPLVLLPALASVSAPHPAPEGLVPQFWAIVFYGAFFALGALVHGQPDWVDRVRPLARWLVPAIAVAYLALLWRLVADPPGLGQSSAPWPTAALEALLSVWLTVGCLLAGRRLLDRANPVMRYLAQSAYWTYLLHLPLLFAIQYLLMDLEWPWPLKFALASAGTLAICLLSYQALVRHTPLRRFVG